MEKGTAMSETKTTAREGFSGFTVLLWFAGGALAGAAAAYLAQVQNRARVLALAQHTRDRVGGLAGALRDASSAAQSAFAEHHDHNGAMK